MVTIYSAPDPYVLPELTNYPFGNKAYGSKVQVSSALVGGETTAVILTLGDSLMSNIVNSIYTPTQTKNHNFNVYNGGCYVSKEPLLGCQINGALYDSGNFFTRVADTLITNGIYQRVIHVPIAVGGSVLADYAEGGSVNGRILPAYRRVLANIGDLTAVYIMLGANDYGTNQTNATLSLNSIISTIRNCGITCNIFVARHTIFGLITNPAVQAAQVSVLNSGTKIYSGGDMDSITSAANYWDNTHYNSAGAIQAAALAVTAITAHP